MIKKGNDTKDNTNRLTREYYYADVKISRDIFMNEWNKKIYISSLEEARILFRTELYAFCILDDRIRILVGGVDVKKRTIRRMLLGSMQIFDRNTEQIEERDVIPADTMVKANVIRLDDEKDAVSVLRYIHLTPFSERYTLSAQDYWWTSYSTYRSHYRWPALDTEPIMNYLGRHDSRVFFTIADFHRRGESLGNPVPECIRRGEYESLPVREAVLLQGNLNETFMARI